MLRDVTTEPTPSIRKALAHAGIILAVVAAGVALFLFPGIWIIPRLFGS